MKSPEDLAPVPVLVERKEEPALHPLLVAAEDPRSPAAERYRLLHQRLGMLPGGRPRVVLVTSALLGEGKTVTAANLAITAALAGARCALVECDLRAPRLRTLFGLPPAMSLVDVLSGRATLAAALQRAPRGGPAVLASGPGGNPSTLLSGWGARRLMEDLRQSYDEIYLDTPAALLYADAHLLAPLVDGTLVVVRAGETTREQIEEAVETIGRPRVLGLVINGVELQRGLYRPAEGA